MQGAWSMVLGLGLGLAEALWISYSSTSGFTLLSHSIYTLSRPFETTASVSAYPMAPEVTTDNPYPEPEMKLSTITIPLLASAWLTLGLAPSTPPPSQGTVAPLGRCCRPNPGLFGLDNNNDRLLRIDTQTGLETVMGPIGFPIGQSSMDFAPNGKLYGICELSDGLDWVVQIRVPKQPTTAPLGTKLVPLDVNLTGLEMAFGTDSTHCYLLEGLTGDIYRVRISSGATELLSNIGLGVPAGLTGGPLGYFTYDRATDALLKLNPLTGSTRDPIPLGIASVLGATPAYAPTSGQVYLRVLPSAIVQVDLASGEVTSLPPLSDASTNIAELAFGPR